MLRLSEAGGPPRAFHDALNDLSDLCGELREQRAFRRHQLEQLAGTLSSESGFTADDPQHQVILDLQSAATTALADIDAALHRVDIGTYGHCQQCDCAISVERLAVLPMVRFCMRCQCAQEGEARRKVARATASD
jgi:RNA polymerase-binding transcription factor DksA